MIRLRNFFLLVFSLAAISLSAQRNGHFIRNYLPKEYAGFNQVWQAAQDKNGVMYFAGTSNVFVYDGQQWERVHVRDGAANRQIILDTASNTMYVGAVNEFGYLTRSPNGKLYYVSISDSLPAAYKKFADVWKIYLLNGCVYFQSTEFIFVVKDKKIVQIIPSSENKGFALAFTAGKKLYVRQRNVGLMEVKKDGSLAPTPGGEIFGTLRILGIIPYDHDYSGTKYLVLTGDKGFYEMCENPAYSGSCYRPLMSDSFLLNAGVLGCLWVNDSTIAINSRTGIGIYDRHLHLREVINKSTGMSDVSISALFLDRQRNVWAMHNNGISCISFNSPILFFDDKIGYTGNLNMSIEYKGEMFFATTEGFFRKTTGDPLNGTPMRLERVSDMQTEVWDVVEFDGDLYLSTSEGLDRYHDGKIEPVTDYYTDLVRIIPGRNEFVTAEKGGFSILESREGKVPAIVRHYDMQGAEILRIGHVRDVPSQPGKMEMWAVNRFKNVQRIRFSVADSLLEITQYDTVNGLPHEEYFPVAIGDTEYIMTVGRCYRYHPQLDKDRSSRCFTEAPDIFNRIYSGDLSGMTPPFDGRLFFYKTHYAGHIFVGEKDGKLFSRRFETGAILSSGGIQYGQPMPNGELWIMSNDLLLYCNSNIAQDTSVRFHPLITQVHFANDSVLMFGTDSPSNTLRDGIPYKYNSIGFRFAAPFFLYNEVTGFSYRLEGLDTGWTKYSATSEKEYMNLPEGTYTFRVRAANSFGTPSDEASYTFTILPPWYRTGWAYTLYGLGFIGSIFFSVRISAQRLRRQKEKLEVLVTERTAEVVEQKQQLEIAFKDIRDSITYAQRIQHAILPMQSEMNRSFPDAFVLFRPRDIVSGDFYWYARKENTSFVACVDCTGHGVPGAFMSMIGNTLLNEIVLEKNVESPEKILNLLHVRVRQALHQDAGGETRDGMDIALCVVDHQRGMLQYAGANRALWVLRKTYVEGGIIELKPVKLSIGGLQTEERRFVLHELQLEAGDCIYMSTDGYADQFGGPKGKKFMVKHFQELLKEIQNLPMEEQKKRLENAFISWKGNLEQVDDVLVIGFRYLS